MQAKIVTYGFWQIPVRVTHCLCPDGKRRNVKLTATPDTFFSIPAKVSYRGTSVTGHVYVSSEPGEPVDYSFSPFAYRKNGDIFSRN